MKNSQTDIEDHLWKNFYRVGGLAAAAVVLTGIIEMIITFLPGGNVTPTTIHEWYALLQNNWFMGLRNLGLLNYFITFFGLFFFLALYGLHRHHCPAWATLALILYILGTGVFFATNRAFSLLDLSRQFLIVNNDAQKSLLIISGQVMLAEGQGHTPGTFMAFFLSEVSAVIMSWTMLKGKIFNVWTCIIGIIGFGFLAVFDICSAFIPYTKDWVLVFAIIGGLLSLVWYILIAKKLLQII